MRSFSLLTSSSCSAFLFLTISLYCAVWLFNLCSNSDETLLVFSSASSANFIASSASLIFISFSSINTSFSCWSFSIVLASRSACFLYFSISSCKSLLIFSSSLILLEYSWMSEVCLPYITCVCLFPYGFWLASITLMHLETSALSRGLSNWKVTCIAIFYLNLIVVLVFKE